MSTPLTNVLSLYMGAAMTVSVFRLDKSRCGANKTSKHRVDYNLIFRLNRSRVLLKAEAGWFSLLPDCLKALFTTCIYPLHYLPVPMFPVCCALQGTLHTASQWVISLSRPTFYTQLYAHTHKMNKPRQAQHSHSHTAEHAGFPQKSKHLLCCLNPY